MSTLARYSLVAMVAGCSAAISAGAMLALAPTPLRVARLAAPDFRLETLGAAPSAAVLKGADGHYWAEGQVNGQPVRFLVDTGATAVALTPQDAERLGFRPQDLNYAYRVTTAGGRSRAAAVTLSSVSVDGARLEDVGALVIEKGLDTSLLGMSYLGRLARFEATREALFLQP
ncbi:TIGR02281 family clan AA aspartic protease [Phenylobacterium sp. J426]|uniref:retropepsin-like aspartic protease family protein n=1 Tax=Phenylobacterium sp. J426 TaxID=2898439 RepID=UPI0021517A04|nr:TIGR02281 family clan AA aspartic protease [Phenylobacterium sp. J426]MCR5876406.1 TIGR02281 family clan AA aspartic protease [Phenylobacterium sp. J426]